jgi:hypothetical protein
MRYSGDQGLDRRNEILVCQDTVCEVRQGWGWLEKAPQSWYA